MEIDGLIGIWYNLLNLFDVVTISHPASLQRYIYISCYITCICETSDSPKFRKKMALLLKLSAVDTDVSKACCPADMAFVRSERFLRFLSAGRGTLGVGHISAQNRVDDSSKVVFLRGRVPSGHQTGRKSSVYLHSPYYWHMIYHDLP